MTEAPTIKRASGPVARVLGLLSIVSASSVAALAAQPVQAWVDGHKAPDAISGYHPGADGRPAFVRTVSPLPSQDEH